jgi:hypothetical protein
MYATTVSYTSMMISNNSPVSMNPMTVFGSVISPVGMVSAIWIARSTTPMPNRSANSAAAASSTPLMNRDVVSETRS